MRIMLYFNLVVSEDVETQKHGAVIIVGVGDQAARRLEYNEDHLKILKNHPFRIAACHHTMSDDSKYQFVQALLFFVVLCKDDQVRTKVRHSSSWSILGIFVFIAVVCC